MLPLSIIIPVWNDPQGLQRIVRQAVELQIAREIIICDDASDSDHSPDALGITGSSTTSLHYIRSPQQLGAGAMRNIGIGAATQRFVLFADSDDMLKPDIKTILQQLEGKHFDFCIFRHHDSRIIGREGTFDTEEKLWAAANATPDVRRLNARESAELAKLSAYPWNKVYRKHFLTSMNIRCTEIPVHNDIELHWTSFIAADTILCSSMMGAVHYVAEDGSRLTNRKGAERLQLFDALEATMERLRNTPESTVYIEPFLGFCYKLAGWAWNNIDPEYHSRLHRLTKKFFMENFSERQLVLTAYRNPDLVGRINKIISGGV
ncbi:glycosyltransferase family 2 protein [Falsirhodobacter algicola]|uniref:Glycosyltransferase n=1 Tax=Falsirhodobacter algicola TaxID=2692330 RepID=A0A8J8MSL5_9RHOB|nr:glycosyltransferase family A protein [Falsirhodobacter algicola]QUS35704.1 glycosyltransferase [Falsirhodobacter algicola]